MYLEPVGSTISLNTIVMAEKNNIEGLFTQFEKQLEAAFGTVQELRGAGQYNMELVQNTLLSVADLLPKKALAHRLRAAIYGKTTTEVKLVEQPMAHPPKNPNRFKAPAYNPGRPQEVKPEQLESTSALEAVDRFTAPQYTMEDGGTITENPTPPAVEEEAVPTTTDNVAEAAAAGSEEPVNEEAMELPVMYLNDTVALEQLEASSAEDLAANFKMAELKAIYEEMGGTAKSNSRIAYARRIKNLAK